MGRNDKQDIDKIDITLDEQIAKFPTGAQVHQAKKGVPIRMIRTDIDFLYGETGVSTGILVCGIATVDGVYYAALCDARQFPPQGYVEEIHLTPARTHIKSTRLVQDPTEWNILADFFNRHNVWEARRIMTWIMSVKDGKARTSENWVADMNKRISGMGAPPITVDEIATGSSKLLDGMIRKDSNKK